MQQFIPLNTPHYDYNIDSKWNYVDFHNDKGIAYCSATSSSAAAFARFATADDDDDDCCTTRLRFAKMKTILLSFRFDDTKCSTYERFFLLEN